jgi:site-specific DNA-methyltransferase (adenine-specific)
MQVLIGNNINLLKDFADNYFDSVVTDPPYGLGKEPNPHELLKDWIEKGFHEIQGKGFMGKEWDAFVPQPNFWKEVFRVLKPGGHVLAFYGTRTYDWGVMAMRFAGFEVRDCIQWLYGSGFPKSHNISKALEGVLGKQGTGFISAGDDGRKSEFKQDLSKRSDYGYRWNPTSKDAKKWDGWGSALKPANEPIVLARKPLEKGLSIAENVLKWGTGGINIDGCRVAFTDNVNMDARQTTNNLSKVKFFDDDRNDLDKPIETYKNGGRFPANLILTHHPECECKGTKKVKSDGHHSGKIPENGGLYKLGLKPLEDKGNIHAENGEETVEDWDCHPDCPIRIMDEQSGNVGGDSRTSKSTYDKGIWGNAKAVESKALYNDKGGASRFFYVAKASKSERNKGLDDFEEKRSSAYGYEIGLGEKGEGMFKDRNPIKQNFHPTVKPVKLMQYLARLITPANGIVLDPFCGSGTTGVACKIEGFEFVGMEQDPEYAKISEARINNFVELIKSQKQNDENVDIEDKQQLKLF